MSLTVITTAKGLIGAFVKTSVPSDCEIDIETLNSKLEAAGLNRFKLRPRAYSDAMRVACSAIMKKSVQEVGDGKAHKLFITPVKPEKGDTDRVWFADWQEIDAADVDKDETSTKGRSYNKLGNIILREDGSLSIPSGLSDVGDVEALAKHFQVVADHTKLKNLTDKILESVGSTVAIGFGPFTTVEKKDYIKNTVAPCFATLDAGEMQFRFLEVEGTAENVQTIQSEVKDTVAKAIDQILAAITVGKSEDVTKGKLVEWINSIQNLKANMAALNMTDVELPTDLEDLELRLEAIKAETPGKRKGRILQIMAAVPKTEEV